MRQAQRPAGRRGTRCSSNKVDGAALPAVQAGRCKASGFGRDGMVSVVWPAVPRCRFRCFDLLAVRSYALVVTRVEVTENSASVLLVPQKPDPNCAPSSDGRRSPVLRVSGVKDRRITRPTMPVCRRQAAVRILYSHAKSRRVPVINQDRFHIRHHWFVMFGCCFSAASADAK